MNTRMPLGPTLGLLALLLLLAWLLCEWQSGYEYEPFGRFLREEVRGVEARFNVWRYGESVYSAGGR